MLLLFFLIGSFWEKQRENLTHRNNQNKSCFIDIVRFFYYFFFVQLSKRSLLLMRVFIFLHVILIFSSYLLSNILLIKSTTLKLYTIFANGILC